MNVTQVNTQTNIPNNVIPFRIPHNYSNPDVRQESKLTSIDSIDFIDSIVNNLASDNDTDNIDDFDRDIKTRHDSEPFKSKEDIEKILTYFLTKHIKSWNTAQKYPDSPTRRWNPRYLRNYILFQIGFSCGPRASDLTRLQIGYFINPDGSYKPETEIKEKKIETKNNTKRNCTTYISKTVVDRNGKAVTTNKVITPDSSVTKNRDSRTIYINQQIIDAIELYKKYHPNWTRRDYLFPNDYNEDGTPCSDYLTRRGLDNIIRTVVKECNIQGRFSTHSVRKSFAYHALQILGNDDRGVLALQRLLNHKRLESTHHYVGLIQDELRSTSMKLGLGFTMDDLQQKGLMN